MGKILSGGFEILSFSDLSYEGMTTDVLYLGKRIAQLNMDRGKSAIEIELLPEGEAQLKVDLVGLLGAIEEAKQLLLSFPEPPP